MSTAELDFKAMARTTHIQRTVEPLPQELLSVVTTTYNSENYIIDFYERIKKTALENDLNFEMIIVDDGSTDTSPVIAQEIAKRDGRVSFIKLSKNFGHHKAMLTGIRFAKGDFVFIIDSDLEEQPELLKTFYDEIKLTEFDAIYGVQKKRKGGFFERVTGAIYYKIFNKLSGTKVPANSSTIRIMSRRYVDKLLEYKESVVFMHGLFHDVGFKQRAIEIDKKHKGVSQYTFRKKVNVLVNSITSFSSKPLNYIFYSGLFCTAIAVGLSGYLLLKKMFFHSPVSGWTSTMIGMLLLSGINFIYLGIIAIYLSRIFTEAKQRPFVIIEEVFKKNGPPMGD